MNLSPHFTLAEFTKTNTIGEPDAAAIQCMRDLCAAILEPVRKHFGLPVTVNSGFRSVEHEHARGRKGNSQHCRGQAADIEIKGVPNAELWLYLAKMPFDQLIAEKLLTTDPAAGWVHVSFIKGGGRRDKLWFDGVNYHHGFGYVDGV